MTHPTDNAPVAQAIRTAANVRADNDHRNTEAAPEGVACGSVRPVRIQLRRTKGFNLQAASMAVNGLPAVKCARPTVFGNPFYAKVAIETGFARDDSEAKAVAVEAFGDWLAGRGSWWMGPESIARRSEILRRMPELRGKNLACFCKDSPCHCDVLLELANKGES